MMAWWAAGGLSAAGSSGCPGGGEDGQSLRRDALRGPFSGRAALPVSRRPLSDPSLWHRRPPLLSQLHLLVVGAFGVRPARMGVPSITVSTRPALSAGPFDLVARGWSQVSFWAQRRISLWVVQPHNASPFAEPACRQA